MKRLVILMLVLLVGANSAQAIWIHMGNGRIVYQIERVCHDGFTLSVAVWLSEDDGIGAYTVYARPYPLELDPYPGSIFTDLYLRGDLPNEEYPQPTPSLVADSYVEVIGRTNTLAVSTELYDFTTNYYGSGDVSWTNGSAPSFGGLPYLAFFTGGNTPAFGSIPTGSFAGTTPLPSGIQNCHLFAPPALIVPGTQNAVAGTPLTIINIGQFTDASYAFDGVNPVFNYTIDWGDGTANSTGTATLDTIGTPSTSTLGSFDGTHTYANSGTYTVTVSVYDNDDGIATKTFNVAVFGPPVLLEPGSGMTTPERRPLFRWNAVPGATRYEIQLGTNNPPQTVVQNAASTQFSPSADLNYTTHYWRVRSINAANATSQWSAIRSIRVIAPPEASPEMNLAVTNTPTLTWNPVTGATGYEIHVSAAVDFPLLLTSIRTVAGDVLSVTTSPLTRGRRYYWRVRAKDGAGVWGAWSPVQTFVISLA